MDIRRVNLNLLVALEALIAERNVTKAALRLNLSQPAMSSNLARLRELFGDPLLVRTAGGMVPTLRALELIDPVRGLLTAASELIQPATFDPGTSHAAYTIAASDIVQAILLPHLFDVLRREAPNLRLTFREINLEQVEAQMTNGELDLCISNRSRAPNLCYELLYWDRVVWIAREGHPLAGEAVTASNLCDFNHADLTNILSDHVEAGFRALGLSRNVVLLVPNYLVLAKIVANSDLVALLPYRLYDQYPDGLIHFETPFDIPGFAVHQLWHKRSEMDSGLRWLRGLISRMFDNRATGRN